jgi:hypothetical protein
MVGELGCSSRRSVRFLVVSSAVRTKVIVETFLFLLLKFILPVIMYNYSSFVNDMNSETTYSVCLV